jgi:predicted Zn-ribbon and HTH transcriptional regulator
MTDEKEDYPMDFVLVPSFRAMAGCPNCKSRNIRVFPNAVFTEENFDALDEASFIHSQAQCKSCGKYITLSQRIRLHDTYYTKSKTDAIGSCSFSTITVGYNSDVVVNEIGDIV